jgi:hypothetical protein
MSPRIGIVTALLWCLSLCPVFAEGPPTVPVRVGSHPGYGRVVFDVPPKTEYRLTQQGQRVIIQFTSDLGCVDGIPDMHS